MNKTSSGMRLVSVCLGLTLATLLFIYLLIIKFTNLAGLVLLAIMGLYILTSLVALKVSQSVTAGKRTNRLASSLAFYYFKFHLPSMNFISKIFREDIDFIRSTFIKLNNYLVKDKLIKDKKKFKASEIAILMPHCLQASNCNKKVTNDINQCIGCGACKLANLKKLQKDYGVNIFIASGGTLARKIIVDKKPKVVLAVACERDLTSGISDMSSRVPVVGILNSRPNGPCFNTDINIGMIKKELDLLIKE